MSNPSFLPGDHGNVPSPIETPKKCASKCESCSGHGWLYTGLTFERCDTCEQFPTDAAAMDRVARLASEAQANDSELALLRSLRDAVLKWASTPGNHGGNPYMKDFVKKAEKAWNTYQK